MKPNQCQLELQVWLWSSVPSESQDGSFQAFLTYTMALSLILLLNQEGSVLSQAYKKMTIWERAVRANFKNSIKLLQHQNLTLKSCKNS